MYMKTNKLSQNHRSKTEMGRAQLSAAPPLFGRLSTSSAWMKIARGGTEQPIKMLKMKIDPEMYMKTKGNNIVG